MARMPRIVWELGLYHVTVRGNAGQQVFYESRDFNKYLGFLKEYKDKFRFYLYAYGLMLTHPHLLIETSKHGSISKIMKSLNQRYAYWHNKKYGKRGHLWENRFYSCIVDKDSYLMECIRYIELNPVRSKLVTDPADYKWTSYRFHAFGKPSPLLDRHPVFDELGKTEMSIREKYREFVKEGLAEPKKGVRRQR